MIAALPMYDWAETTSATDALWALVRGHLGRQGLDAPEQLTRTGDLWAIWSDPDLVLAQTCGMPYRTRLHANVALVGTPDYGLPDTPFGHYHSVIVARREDGRDFAELASGVLAINDPVSQSGWSAIHAHAAPRGLTFAQVIVTGAHKESAGAVALGRADLASIDAVTWRLVERYLPDVAGQLRIVERTLPTPGLPLITAASRDPAPLAEAFRAALHALPAEVRQTLGIAGLASLSAADYLAVENPPEPFVEPA